MDCLICHAQWYQRDLYPDGQGGVWKPVLWKNQEGLDSVAERIGLPTRNTCLRCHAGSGGGPNYKRGDLEYALAETDRNFDVHMGSDGANLQCIDCHKGGTNASAAGGRISPLPTPRRNRFPATMARATIGVPTRQRC
jgi:hypothetical protein